MTYSSPPPSRLASKSGSGGGVERGPMYAQTIPFRSWVGYAVACTLVLKSDSAGSLGMSTQWPAASNFQPWYTQRRPSSSLRPKNSDAPRCGQLFWISPMLPVLVLKPISSSPSSLTRSGAPSRSGSSSALIAGTQYCRIKLPIGVPGPDATQNTRCLPCSAYRSG